ncbi:MAG: hypothetical protein FJY86_03145 [Candidatus Diapherotrites archaeon]|uniref:Uncharacterized protein n=1 Tax=Candidatus Iainarchaeum sp. TaxID=3101447 RepID=A0A8T4C8M5_9ARCH|nr:hypothetical protein [Candidatus Diapherotrites archaeon]
MAKKSKKGPAKIAGKQIRKQVKSLNENVRDVRKGVAKEVTRATKKMASQTKDIKEELSKLSDDLKAMKTKGKEPKRELSMYNLFVRKQIEQGKTFEEATKLWKSSRKVIENPELANVKPKTRTKTITKTKVVVKKVPKIVVRKVPMYDPNANSVSKETKESLNKVMRELNALKTEMSSAVPEVQSMSMPKNHKPFPSLMQSSSDLSNEEVAVRLTRLYFEEIARLGFKRRLDFDAIINAYYYCLQRLENKDKEMDVMRKLVDREENKITHESKAQLFPEMNE